MPPHDFHKFRRAICAGEVIFGLDYVAFEMIFQQFNDEAVRRPTDRGGEVQDIPARGPGLERAFDCLHLAFQPPDPGEEGRFVVCYMTHRVGGYPILRKDARSALDRL